MDFVRSHFGKIKLWPVEHCTDLEKKWAKSVQLVRVSFFRSDFLQNPYFRWLPNSSEFWWTGLVSKNADDYQILQDLDDHSILLKFFKDFDQIYF